MIAYTPSWMQVFSASVLASVPSHSMIKLYKTPMGLRALNQLRQNVESLLFRRKENQKTLADATGIDPTTLNKFLRGTREIQLKDLDAIADFFGIATYQLFQPGIAPLTERRVGERRRGQERRIGHQARELHRVEAGVNHARRRHPDLGEKPALSSADVHEFHRIAVDLERRLGTIVQASAPRRQAPDSGASLADAPVPRRKARRSNSAKT
jgi:transcriptional regulator with XRE-family HTH domain